MMCRRRKGGTYPLPHDFQRRHSKGTHHPQTCRRRQSADEGRQPAPRQEAGVAINHIGLSARRAPDLRLKALPRLHSSGRRWSAAIDLIPGAHRRLAVAADPQGRGLHTAPIFDSVWEPMVAVIPVASPLRNEPNSHPAAQQTGRHQYGLRSPAWRWSPTCCAGAGPCTIRPPTPPPTTTVNLSCFEWFVNVIRHHMQEAP
jgi:hypothetical protein